MMPYIGIGPERGRVVDFDEAIDYAMEQIGISPITGRSLCEEFLDALESWYYSGNWLREEELHELFEGNQSVL